MKSVQRDKATVILIHGMWSHQNTLSELQEAFINQGYKTEALCLPYHMPKKEHTEESKTRLAQMRLQDYVAYIVERIKLEKTPPILVGHSMGGLLAQLVATQVPCQRLILLSSAPPAGVNSFSLSAIKTLGTNWFRFPLWKKITELNLKNIQYGLANSQSLEYQQTINDSCTFESGMATLQISMGLLLRSRSAAYVNVQKINCPVLVIGGTADRITPINIQRSIVQRFGQQAQLVEISDCCHWTVGGRYFDHIQTEIFNWLKG